MIKVLQVTGAMNRGGAEVMIMDIYKNISPEFHFDFLVNYNLKKGIIEGDFDAEILSTASKIKHIPAQWDIGPFLYIKKFKEIIKEIGTPDIIHIHMNAKSGIIAIAAKLAGIKKIIIHSHGDITFKGKFLKNSLTIAEHYAQKILINHCGTDFWGCSPAALKSFFYSSKIKRGETVIINNAIDVNKYTNYDKEEGEILKASFQRNSNTLVIGAVGRIVRRKNVKFIIEILHELDLQNVDFIFVNAGKVVDVEYMKEIEDAILNYNLTSKVIHLGLRDDIPTVMSTFDVFVSPAYSEAFGMVAAEAQAAGLPSVLSTEFPKSIDMQLGLVYFIEKFETKLWAEKILQVSYNKLSNKQSIELNFQALGFDIKTNIRNIENLYSK